MLIWDKGLERNFEYGPNVYRGAVLDEIWCMANLTQTEVQWSLNEIVLTGIMVTPFCYNFANNGSTVLKF